MHACHGCQERLLDSLYGLLDSAEQQELQAHLDGCADCRAAQEKARAAQQTLAAAARLGFSEVSFTPPPAAPVFLPIRPRVPRKAARWRPWAAAAAVILAVSGLSLPAYRASADYSTARLAATSHEQAIAESMAEAREAEQQLAQAKEIRDQAIHEVEREVKAREMRLVVSGPRNVQPGAPAEFQVRAYDLHDQPTDAKLSVSIEGQRTSRAAKGMPAVKKPDSRGKQAVDASPEPRIEKLAQGVYSVKLPPTLPLDAGRTLVMAVKAKRTGVQRESNGLSLRGMVRLSSPGYLTHLTTDKPMYQPGEVVHFSSLTLDRATLAPPAEPLLLRYTLTNPLGQVRQVAAGLSSLQQYDEKTRAFKETKGPDGKPTTGLGAGELRLDLDARGGEYVLTVSDDQQRFPATTRRFVVNEYRKPRLDKKLVFNRSSYGPGSEVQVSATAKRLDGGPLRACPVEAVATIDGIQVATARGQTNDEGRAVLAFKLPAKMERGLGSLTVRFDAPGTPETAARPIPIVLNKMQVEFFPEGGDLVAGQPARVYFQARTPAGKPAQLTGMLLENGKPTGIRAETLSDGKEAGVNQGLGSFCFTPLSGRTYSLRIDSPHGIADAKKLPVVRADGVSLRVEKGVFQPKDPIRVKVFSSRPRRLLVGAYCRDTLLDSAPLEPGQTEAVLRPVSSVGGVCRITVFEVLHTGTEQRQLRPRAERLVFRAPGKRLDLSIKPDKRHYAPGERAAVTIQATNENEKPVSALAQIAIIDQAVVGLADERTARTGPTFFLLTNEVRQAEDLEHADFLLGQHPRAALVLDHLLGTQGWRRFAEQDPQRFRRALPHDEAGKEEAERLLVMIGQSEPRTTDFDQERKDAAQEKFDENSQDILARHAEATAKAETLASDAGYLAALTTLNGYAGLVRACRAIALPVLLTLSLLAALFALWQAIRKHSGWAYSLGTLSGGLACLLAWLAFAPPGLKFSTPMQPGPLAQLALPSDNVKAPHGGEDAVPTRFPESAPAEKKAEGGGRAPASHPAAPPPPSPRMGLADKAGNGAPVAPGMGIGGPGAPRAGGAGLLGGHPSDRKLNAANGSTGLSHKPGKGHPVDRIATLHPMRQYAKKPASSTKRKDRGPAEGMFGGRPGRGAGRGWRFADRESKKQMEHGLKELAPLPQPLAYRVYAHTRPEGVSATIRADFAEMVYWHPALLLADGKGEACFQLPDSVTRFSASVFAHTLDGRLGAATKLIDSRLPVNAAPRLPTEVTATDRILAPVSISSTVAKNLAGTLTVTDHAGFALEGGAARAFGLPPQGSRRVLIDLKPTIKNGTATLAVKANGPAFAGDAVSQSVRVVPEGFPIERSSSDLLEKSATHILDVPADMVPGTLAVRLDVYPSLLADLTRGLDGLLREPHGCFEQTSTTNYPNVLILDFLKANKKANPETEARARGLLQKGYARLTSFECQDGNSKARRGYEWFGGTAPPHDALTAYGLMQFTDMARLMPIDQAMLARTRAYLLSLRDGKGGFKHSTARYSFGGAPRHLADAYIVWALALTGNDDLAREEAALLAKTRDSEDAYFLSLAALALATRGKAPDAEALLRRVARVQQADGHLDAQTSITRSGGKDLQIETTALAVMGWLKVNKGAFARNVHLAIKWLGTQRQGSGSFGSTQSTILALKALLAQSVGTPRPVQDAELVVYLGDREVARRKILADAKGLVSIEIPAPEKTLKPGTSARLRVELSGAATYPHTVGWTYRAVTPANEAKQLVHLTTKLAKTDLREGDPARLWVSIANRTGTAQGMTTAIVGIPAGLSLPENLEQLRTLCKLPPGGKAPLLSAFEVKGRELVLYWRGLNKDQTIEVPLSLVAKVPGTYRGPASRAYLYYNARNKHWVAPLAVRIAPIE